MHCNLHLPAGAARQFQNIFAAELFKICLRDIIGKKTVLNEGKNTKSRKTPKIPNFPAGWLTNTAVRNNITK